MRLEAGYVAVRDTVRFDTVILPTDFTLASESAASYALFLARQHKARLVVAHVVDVRVEAAGFYLPHLSYEKLDEELIDAAGEMLSKFRARAIGRYKKTEVRLLKGEPYREILRLAGSYKACLVVMGTFGKERIDRFFFGSTTERVVRGATCPVMVIPPPREVI